MYLIWSVIHFVVIVLLYLYNGAFSKEIIQDYLINDVLRGKYGVLWYLYALVGGNLVAWCLYKIHPKLMLTCAVIVTAIMALGDTYFYALPQQSILVSWFNAYYAVALTFRTPFFIGLSLSTVGYLIAKSENTPIHYLKLKTTVVWVGFCLEFTITRALNFPHEYSWYLFTVPVAYYVVQLFRTVKFSKATPATCQYCRKVSGLLYFTHILVLQCLQYMFSFVPAAATGETFWPTIFSMIFVTLTTIELSNILIRLSTYPIFSFLNKII